MSLRRFPWKLPRSSDISFKLFASPPTPGTPAVEMLARNLSISDAEDHAAVSAAASSGPASTSTSSDNTDGASQQTIKGPWRLLRLLPRESRYIIGRMLDLDPRRRATLEEIHADKWVQGSPVCTQEPGGHVIAAPGHDHVLQPGAGDPAARK